MRKFIALAIVVILAFNLNYSNAIAMNAISEHSPSGVYFPAHVKHRAWQGVAVDDKNIYVTTDRDENFGLEDIISVYTLDGRFIKEKRNAYTGKDSEGKFMSFGDGTIIDGHLFVTAYNANAGTNSFMSRIVKYNLPNLDIAAEYDIGQGVAESVYKYLDNYWVVSFEAPLTIKRFDIDFNLIKTYDLSASFGPEGGYQGAFFDGDILYANLHGSNYQGQKYAYGLDRYSFDGEKFNYIDRIKPPTYGAGQGIEHANDKYYWADRPGNRIVITDQIESSKIVPLTGEITENDIITPNLLNQWVPFDNLRTATYYRDSQGIVHLEGMIKGGTIGDGAQAAAAFILPDGYKPKLTKNFPVVSNNAFGRVNVTMAGDVYVTVGSNEWVSLDGISFLADSDDEQLMN